MLPVYEASGYGKRHREYGRLLTSRIDLESRNQYHHNHQARGKDRNYTVQKRFQRGPLEYRKRFR